MVDWLYMKIADRVDKKFAKEAKAKQDVFEVVVVYEIEGVDRVDEVDGVDVVDGINRVDESDGIDKHRGIVLLLQSTLVVEWQVAEVMSKIRSLECWF